MGGDAKKRVQLEKCLKSEDKIKNLDTTITNRTGRLSEEKRE